MPLAKKRVFKKKSNYPKKRPKRSSAVSGGSRVISFSPSKNMFPLPLRLRTYFRTAIHGYYDSGAVGYRNNIHFNRLLSPFDVSSNPMPNIVGFPVTVNPTGYLTIVNVNLYQYVRVIGCSIKMTIRPEALSDSCGLSITGTRVLDTPDSFKQAQAFPNTRKSVFASSVTPSGDATKRSELKLSLSQAQLLSTKEKAIEYDLSRNYTHGYNGNPNIPNYFCINMESLDGQALSREVPYSIELTHHVELWTDGHSTYNQ